MKVGDMVRFTGRWGLDGCFMKPGDMVRYLDEEYLDVGVVMHIHEEVDGCQRIDVLWDNGISTHFDDEMEAIDESR